MPAGRPRTLAPEDVKSEVISARLTGRDKELVINIFGSIQNFIDHVLLVLIKKSEKEDL